jgi:2-keto-3-deoxy-galactonokinase
MAFNISYLFHKLVMANFIHHSLSKVFALNAQAEMYIQGVSTRKVNAILSELCGFEVTSSEVSRAIQELDGKRLVGQPQ